MRPVFPRLRRAAILACAPLAFTLACNDSSTGPSAADVAGVYTLQTIGGAGLPVTFQNGTSTVTLTSDVITVGSDGTWSEAETFQQTVNGQTTPGSLSDGGTWTLDGTAVSFFSDVNGVTDYIGTYSAGTLTLDAGDGQAQVFLR